MLHHVRGRLVAGHHVRARLRAGVVAVAGHEAAHVGARDLHAAVHGLVVSLDRREAGRHRVGRRPLLVGTDARRSSRVAAVDHRQDRSGEGPAFGDLLVAAVQLGHLVRVAQRALHERHLHLLDDRVLDGLALVALVGRESVAAGREQAEQVRVDGAGASVRIAVAVAGARAEVRAALVRQRVQQLAAAAPVRALEGAGVERPALVPRVHAAVVVGSVASAAVADGVLHLVDHVHPDVLVRGALLRQLNARDGRSAGKGASALHGRAHEVVGVGVAVPVGAVDLVGRLAVHLGSRVRGEAGDRTHGAARLHGVTAVVVHREGVGVVLRRQVGLEVVLVEVDFRVLHDIGAGRVSCNRRRRHGRDVQRKESKDANHAVHDP